MQATDEFCEDIFMIVYDKLWIALRTRVYLRTGYINIIISAELRYTD